jgi:prephenate dehydrogenase
MDDSRPFSPVALLGMGYMGGSLALAAREAGLVDRVVGFDRDPEAGRVARARGIVDEVSGAAEAAVAGAALVILATPVASLGALATQIAPAVRPDALVIDIGSVKAPVVQAIERTPLAGRYVGCHPIAGLEVSGAAHAHAGLYEGKPCYVCPGPRAQAQAIAAAESFWTGLGAHVVRLAPEPHDALMAAASHLPHVAAFALADSLSGVADALVAGIPAASPPTSLRDTTRVAASSPVMWRDIFLENSSALLPLVGALERSLGALRAAIEAGDGAALEALLRNARETRRRVVKSA